MTRREYAGGAPVTALAAGITSSALSFTVTGGGGSGYPTGAVGPFFLVIDEATANEEKVLCSSRAGDVFTIAGSGRGADDTVAVSHPSGASVRHIFTATDADEANDHVNTGAAVHGVTGNIVGDSDAQTLTNKTIASAANTLDIDQADVTDLVADQAAQDALIAATQADLDVEEAATLAHRNATAAHGATGAVVGTTNSQTLTNKTIDGDNNTIRDIALSSLKRAVLIKNSSGGLSATIAPGSSGSLNANFSTAVTITETGGSWSGGFHSSQWTHPVAGLYFITARGRWAPVSAPAGTDMRVYMYLRGGMTSSDASTGTPVISQVQTIRDTGNENESNIHGIYVVTSTSTVYGLTFFNSSVSDQNLERDDAGAGTYFQVFYLGPAS